MKAAAAAARLAVLAAAAVAYQYHRKAGEENQCGAIHRNENQ